MKSEGSSFLFLSSYFFIHPSHFPKLQHLMTKTTTNNEASANLGKQLLRSGTSVGANYREAHRGRSKPEFIAKCGDSLRELEESAYWLELLVDGEIVSGDKVHREGDVHGQSHHQ
jgi:four helix bundle protein